MNTPQNDGGKVKPQTIDEVIGNPPGTFAKFAKDHPDPDAYILGKQLEDNKESLPAPTPEPAREEWRVGDKSGQAFHS
jgi:hypothetical protein